MTAMTNSLIWSKTCSYSKRMVVPKWLKADSQHRSLSSIGRHDVIKYQMSKAFEMGVWESLLKWHSSLGYHPPWNWNPCFRTRWVLRKGAAVQHGPRCILSNADTVPRSHGMPHAAPRGPAFPRNSLGLSVKVQLNSGPAGDPLTEWKTFWAEGTPGPAPWFHRSWRQSKARKTHT